MKNWIVLSVEVGSLGIRVRGCLSDWGPLQSRVPQGSASEPLLFPKNVSIITDRLENTWLVFADDMKLVGMANIEAIRIDLHGVYR